MGDLHTSRICGLVTATLILMGAPSGVTAQITGLAMYVSQSDPRGSWALEQSNVFAHGIFSGPGSGEFPSEYLSFGISHGMTVGMNWLADSEDGFQGSMLLNGKEYLLDGFPESFMQVTANPLVVNNAGLYQEPFRFSATFCAAASVGSLDCDVRVDAAGVGTLAVSIQSLPQVPGAFAIQRIDYTIGEIKGTRETGTLMLLAAGVGALGLKRLRRQRRLLEYPGSLSV